MLFYYIDIIINYDVTQYYPRLIEYINLDIIVEFVNRLAATVVNK